MGDGGVIAQVADVSGAIVAVTDAGWKCLTIHRAPIDVACADEGDPEAGTGACAYEIVEEPEGWDEAEFDASTWPQATVQPAAAVDPKMGFDQIDWAEAAEFVRGPDLHQDNTILCRLVVD